MTTDLRHACSVQVSLSASCKLKRTANGRHVADNLSKTKEEQ